MHVDAGKPVHAATADARLAIEKRPRAAVIVYVDPYEVIPMGDKSPKAKDKAKKQHSDDKNQKHAAAVQKAKPPAAAAAAKKGK